jgi:hypothetical protein
MALLDLLFEHGAAENESDSAASNVVAGALLFLLMLLLLVLLVLLLVLLVLLQLLHALWLSLRLLSLMGSLLQLVVLHLYL